jgi:phage terminase small subunit
VSKNRKDKLTPKQLMFCKEYVVDFNGSRAAAASGYSKKASKEQASLLLTRTNIQQEIQRLLKSRVEKLEKSGDDVVRLLWKMAELDLADYLTVAEGGEIQAIAFDSLPEGATKLLSKIKEKRTIAESADGTKQTMYGTLEYELPEKTKCLELLGKHYGIFNDKFKEDDAYVLPVNVTIQVKDARRTG